MTIARVAEYPCLIRHVTKRWWIKAAQRNGVARATWLGFDAMFGASLSPEEFGGYALFIAAHL